MIERLRSRQYEQADAVAAYQARGAPPPVYPAVVGRVFGDPTVPTAAGVYYSVHPVTVLGTETEGQPGTLSVDTTRPFRAVVLGGAAAAGDDLVCRFVGDRWVAWKKVASGTERVPTPDCPCATTPAALTQTVTHPEASGGVLEDCTYQYGPTPASLAGLNLGANCFLSTAQFVDGSTGDLFWYNFKCLVGAYAVTRVYAESHYGSPYRDTIRYRWDMTASGNTCTPFALTNGLIFQGGGTDCVVTITE